ncbi:MAG: hypothetical protein V4489_02260 [Chlamydiota bacterium]
MGSIGQDGRVTGVYLIDSWLRDTRLSITGYDFVCGSEDNAKFVLGLRITSVALRLLGVVLGKYFMTSILSGRLLVSIPLFILSHDCLVVGNNLSDEIKNSIDSLTSKDSTIANVVFKVGEFLGVLSEKDEFLQVVKKTLYVAWKNLNNLEGAWEDPEGAFQAIKKDLGGIGLDIAMRKLEPGTITGGGLRTYFLIANGTKPS